MRLVPQRWEPCTDEKTLRSPQGIVRAATVTPSLRRSFYSVIQCVMGTVDSSAHLNEGGGAPASPVAHDDVRLAIALLRTVRASR